jgi:hypothetical protein
MLKASSSFCLGIMEGKMVSSTRTWSSTWTRNPFRYHKSHESNHLIRASGITVSCAYLRSQHEPNYCATWYLCYRTMDQPEGKPASKEYSFVMQENMGDEQLGPLTLLRRSKRVLGDIDLGEASIPTQSGRCNHFLSTVFPFAYYFLFLSYLCLVVSQAELALESSTSEPSTSKRREQVRKAQRYVQR